MIKILLVDDQRTIRQALRMRLALEPDITVIGEAGDGAEALNLIPLLHPDVVVMDVKMPHMDGMACTAALRAVAPDAVVVILTLHDSPAVRAQAMEAGAAAFLGKHNASELLPATIRQAAVGSGASG
jgi:DNA-binding NarL/FixJ family response regulator